MRWTAAGLAIASLVSAATACTGARYGQPQSYVDETLSITLPAGFSKQADLSQAIADAASRAAAQHGVLGSVNIDESSFSAAQPASTTDPYLAALTDAQHHAAEISKATGLPLGHITSVREDRGVPGNPQYVGNRVTLEVDYGSALSVYGSSSPQTPYSPYPPPTSPRTLNIRINGSGASGTDAKTSADAFEAAARDALSKFGIGQGAIVVTGGMVNVTR